jgi:predicted nucleic acid-binding Zn ribbon protein
MTGLTRSIALKRTPFKRKPLGQRGPVLTSTTPRRRKCVVCAEPFKPQRMGQKVCSVGCAQVQGRRETEKQDRKDTRERKAKLKTRSQHIAETQAAFNALVRFRDRNETCISCSTVLSTLAEQPGGGYDCGHYRSRGSAPHLRFDFRNAHGQCKKCNRYRAGNAADYRIGLIGRIGLQAVEELEADQTGGDWTIAGLEAMKADFKAQLRALKEKA